MYGSPGFWNFEEANRVSVVCDGEEMTPESFHVLCGAVGEDPGQGLEELGNGAS